MEDKDIDWGKHGLMSDEELKEIDDNFKRIEIEGVQNILKYFDRIHDKLFNFNNILIGGYFALSQIYDSFSIYGIIIPLINLFLLLFIEYRMMGKSRFEADVREKTSEEIDKNGKAIDKTNLYSLLAISSTTIVIGIFIYNLFTIENNKDNSQAPLINETTDSKNFNQKLSPESISQSVVLFESKINEIQLPFPKKDMVSDLQSLFGQYKILKEIGQQDGPDFPLYSIKHENADIVFFGMNDMDTLLLDNIYVQDSIIKDQYGLKVGDNLSLIKKNRGNGKIGFDPYHYHMYYYYDNSKILYELTGDLKPINADEIDSIVIEEEDIKDWKIEYLIWR